MFDLPLIFERYDLPDYEFEDNFETNRIEVLALSDKFTPLRTSSSSILIKTKVYIAVDGRGVVVDEDMSKWDSKRGRYSWKAYSELSLTSGTAVVECEIELTFDPVSPIETASISWVKLNNRRNIEVGNGKVRFTPMDYDDEYYTEMMEDIAIGRAEMLDAQEAYWSH